ncbi:hypothetical protein ACI65C_006525 [Semiaphis heraclei]
MSDNVSSWLIESEKIDYLEDSDDTDADPDYVDCANEHIENEYDDSDDDFSESNVSYSNRSIIIPRSRSRSRSPLPEPSYYLGKDNKTKWFFDPPSNKIRTRRRNIVLHLPGVKRVARDAVSILDCWKLYFPNSDIDNIVKCTNIYLDKLRQNYSNQRNELTKPFMINRLQQPNLSISLRQQIIKMSGHKTSVNVDQSSSSGSRPKCTICPKKKNRKTMVSSAVRFLAQGTYQRGVGKETNIGLSQPLVSRVLNEVIDCINLHILQKFRTRFHIPGVIGVIDGSQIGIFPPSNNHNQYPEFVYVNRKGFHSINTQLVSDSGYPLEPWLQSSESRFNVKFTSARSVVERAIGMLKGRWKCLCKQRMLHYKPTIAMMLLKSNLLYCSANKEISSSFSKFCSGALYFHLIEKRESS